MLREALKSIADQTHRDYQLIVVDDSSRINAFDAVREFDFPESRVIHERVSPEERAQVNRLGVNINKGLRHATGDVITYLADDDAYFPGWFAAVSDHFEKHPDHQVAFGVLKYCRDEIDFSETGETRFWDETIYDPMGKLDHNQVIHRRFDPPVKWLENLGSETNSDGWFFNQLAISHPFHPISSWAAVKRIHSKNLQGSVSLYQSGQMSDLRE